MTRESSGELDNEMDDRLTLATSSLEKDLAGGAVWVAMMITVEA